MSREAILEEVSEINKDLEAFSERFDEHTRKGRKMLLQLLSSERR